MECEWEGCALFLDLARKKSSHTIPDPPSILFASWIQKIQSQDCEAPGNGCPSSQKDPGSLNHHGDQPAPIG